jgi:hypothetical protein
MNLRWTWGSGPAGLSTDSFSMLVMGLTRAEWTGDWGRRECFRVTFELPTQRSGDLVQDRQDGSAVRWPRCARKIPVGRGFE